MISEKEAFEKLLDGQIIELAKAKYYVDFYKDEVINHKTVSKAQAEENLETWEKRVKDLNRDLKKLQEYAKRTY